jgi:hypothetical protein
MNINSIFPELIKICGSENVSNDASTLKTYSSDMSYVEAKAPICIVWPSDAEEIERIVKLANKMNFSLIPISSGAGSRLHGDTIPHKDNCVVLDLSKMKKLLKIDKKNRVMMIEPGVTFSEIIPTLEKKGLKMNIPLHPRASKSVLASTLEREPVTIPRYMWDSTDPLLCTEVIFGTGDLFRTGTAAGPGTLKQQEKAGVAHLNPMGPTQFSPYRVIQGSQGSIGVVTWATIKLEMKPTIQKVYHIQSDELQELLDFQHELIKYRLCDELLILNNLNLACLLKQTPQEINNLAKELKKWNLIYVLAGRGKLANDKLEYLIGDISDIMEEQGLDPSKDNEIINQTDVLRVLRQPDTNAWRIRLKGGHQDIFFLTNFERIPEYISIMESQNSYDLGVYIQALNQGTSHHCEFNIYYDPTNVEESKTIKEDFLKISTKLMDAGAFFNRPYGLWAKEAYERHGTSTQMALRKVKQIFDPNNVLNPGVLCFDD